MIDRRRRLAECTRCEIGVQLGLSTDPVDPPTSSALFVCTVNRKTCASIPGDCNHNGKASALSHFGMSILIDDTLDIIREVSESGIIGYKVFQSRSRRDEQDYGDRVLKDNSFGHPSNLSVIDTVGGII